MPIRVLELHPHGIRIGKSARSRIQGPGVLYGPAGTLGHTGRPTSLVFLAWLYVGNDQNTAQIHLMGAEGRSQEWPRRGITGRSDHALNGLAVEDIREARRELDQRGVWYWQIQGLVGQNSDQIFVRDPLWQCH